MQKDHFVNSFTAVVTSSHWCFETDGWVNRKDIWPMKNLVPPIPRGSLPEQVKEEDLKGN